jgi:hypothetical protein
MVDGLHANSFCLANGSNCNSSSTIAYNTTQFEIGEPITIKESWLTTFINWVFGNSISSNLNMQEYNITNVTSIQPVNVTGNCLITGAGITKNTTHYCFN